MILKSLSRKSGTGQLLKYLFSKEDKIISNAQKPIIIRHNVRSRTMNKWVKEFDANEKLRIHQRKNSVKVYHEVLSFSNKDKEKITEKTIRDVAKQYMKLRSNDNLYIGTAHSDKDHVHIHMVMSGTKYLTGEANRISRTQFRELKVAMDTWQQKKYPELIHSLPKHGRSNESKKGFKEPVIDRRNGRISTKENLLKTLEEGYNKSKSVESFLSTLQKKGYEPYYRSGRLTGVKSEDGLKFRFNRLGYTQDKIAKLDELRIKQENELSEIKNIRERHSEQREQTDERNERNFEREFEPKEEKDESHFQEDDDRNLDENEMDELTQDDDNMR